MNKKSSFRQAGLVTVEFALIGAVFFLVLFAIIEMGRFLFTWNVLDEVTRRAARLTAVCPMTEASVDNVKTSAVFGGSIIPGLNAEQVTIEYLDNGLNSFSVTDTDLVVGNVRYVRASIQDFEYQLLIPNFGFLPDAFSSPFNASSFTTTLPSESLGVIPAGSGGWPVTCTGAF